ncbi:hypothetical protein VI817_000290 [Penicillium citrinum]|nr:hypothetical protein VI817_000290 [Penicillium citrinum]
MDFLQVVKPKSGSGMSGGEMKVQTVQTVQTVRNEEETAFEMSVSWREECEIHFLELIASN